MKKGLALLMAALLFGSALAFSVSAETEEEPLVDFVLDVESGRSPRILLLADPQIMDSTQYSDNPNADNDPQKRLEDMEARCFRYIRQVVNNTKPDLILIAGDIVYGQYDHSGEAFGEMVKFFDGFGIPWAPVYGNHDAESNIGVLWQNEQFENAEHCLFRRGNVTGNGNYTVGIRQNGKLTRVFFMMDSNGCDRPGKESIMHVMPGGVGFMEDQVEWFAQQGAAIKEANPDVNFSFVFHIPFQIFTEAMSSVPVGDMGLTATENENFGYMRFQECGVDWDRNRATYSAMKGMGTDSIMVGHWHTLSASVVYDGVRFMFGQKSSTYDSANYKTEDGTIVGSKDITAGEPLIGGTLMLMDEQTGDFTGFEIVLYEEPPKQDKNYTWIFPVATAVIPALMAAYIVFRDRKKK